MLTSGAPIPKPEAAPSLESRLKTQIAEGQLQAPGFPSIALEINRILRNPKSSAADLAKVLATDETLAVRVLRRANGPGMNGKGLTSLPLAVARLGRRELAEVVYAATLGETAERAGPLLRLRKRVWLEAVISAVLNRRLASTRSVNEDEAFLAGLVHDFGRVLTLGALEDLIAEGVEVQPMKMSDWLELIDRYHLEVGARAAEQWRLPPALSDAMRCHHRPRRAAVDHRALITLVSIVDQVFECLMAAPHVGRDLLTKRVKTPLRGTEASIVQALPGTGDEAATLVAATSGGLKARPTPLILDESLLASDQYPLDAQLKLDDGAPVAVQSVTRDGVVVDGAPDDGLRIATAALLVGDDVPVRATVLVQGIEDHTECRWFALTPAQKKAWDSLFRAARSH
jgi:HD-like signal output (HDOD) protein